METPILSPSSVASLPSASTSMNGVASPSTATLTQTPTTPRSIVAHPRIKLGVHGWPQQQADGQPERPRSGRARIILGEGPIWCESEQCVFFIDIEGKRLHQFRPYEPKTNKFRHRTIDFSEYGMLGNVSLTEHPTQLLVTTQKGLVLYDWSNSSSFLLFDFPQDNKLFRYNDGTITPAGSLMVGTLRLDENDREPEKGTFYEYYWREDSQQMIQKRLFDGALCSNGLVFNHDHTHMYYIDTPLRRIDVFDYDGSTETLLSSTSPLSNRRVAFSVNSLPDGMTIDSDDHLWIAHWNGACVTQYTTGGQLLRTIHLSTPKTTSVCFGGRDLTDLFVTSASRDEKRQEYPDAGSLFYVPSVGARGRLPHVFKGRIDLDPCRSKSIRLMKTPAHHRCHYHTHEPPHAAAPSARRQARLAAKQTAANEAALKTALASQPKEPTSWPRVVFTNIALGMAATFGTLLIEALRRRWSGSEATTTATATATATTTTR